MKRTELKDVISQNLNTESLQKLLGEIDANEIDSMYKIVDIDIKSIHPNPNQPRKHFDNDKLSELAESIKIHGLITPIMVQKDNNGYMIIAGERRYRASLIANKSTIKCIICNLSEQFIEEIALIENIQRENLNVIEEAEAYNTMIKKYQYTHEQISSRIGKSREYITNIIRLLKLPENIKDKVVSGELSAGHAKTLLALDNEDEMTKLMSKIIEEKISVRKTEEIIKFKKKNISTHLYEKEEKILEEILGVKVSISKTKLSINFNDETKINEIINIFQTKKED